MGYSKGLEELLESHTKRWERLKEHHKSSIPSVLDEVITEELIVVCEVITPLIEFRAELDMLFGGA